MSPTSSGSKKKPSKKSARVYETSVKNLRSTWRFIQENRHIFCLLIACSAYTSTVKKEVVFSSLEKCHISEGAILSIHRRKDLIIWPRFISCVHCALFGHICLSSSLHCASVAQSI
jgi:hypothetical protein